METETSR